MEDSLLGLHLSLYIETRDPTVSSPTQAANMVEEKLPHKRGWHFFDEAVQTTPCC